MHELVNQQPERAEVTEEGILLWYKDIKYPLRGTFHEEGVRAVGIIKKALLFYLKSTNWKSIFGVDKIIQGWVDFSLIVLTEYSKLNWQGIDLINPKHFCKSGQELYRVIGNKNLALVVCAIWEFSQGYRFKGQDILGELNKKALKANNKKEIKRLVNLMISREVNFCTRFEGTPQVKEPEIIEGLPKEKIDKLLFLMRFVNLKQLAEILGRLDLDKIRLDEGDRWWVKDRIDYSFSEWSDIFYS